MRLTSRFSRHLRFKTFARDRHAATLVEAAIILPVFLLFLFVLFEVAYGQFLQGVLESAVQQTAYQMQINQTTSTTANGNTTTTLIDNTADAKTFVDTYLCPNTVASGLLSCGSLYVRVQQFNTATCTDFFQATDGTLPVSGGTLNLGYYAGEQAGAGGSAGPTNCESTSTTGGVGYCNPAPNEYIILTAVYVAPSFLYSLIPGQGYTYGGRYVHAAYASSAFYTENFATITNQAKPC